MKPTAEEKAASQKEKSRKKTKPRIEHGDAYLDQYPPEKREEIKQYREKMKDQIEQERAAFQKDDIEKNPEPVEITPKDIHMALRTNEYGDSDLFSMLFRDKFLFDCELNEWFRFTGHFWEQDLKKSVIHNVRAVVRLYHDEMIRQAEKCTEATKAGSKEEAKQHERLEKDLAQRVKNLQTLSRAKKIIELAGAGDLGEEKVRWDNNPWLLACLNGVVDLKTGEIREGKPGDSIRTYCPHVWKGLDEPCILDDLLMSTLDDPEVCHFLFKYLGYCITGLTTEDRFLILEGRGRNGKTTITETLGYVLDSYVGPINSEMLLEQRHHRSGSAPAPDLLYLRGKRLVWASETDEGRRLSIARVKRLSSKDKINARPLFGKNEITFNPTHKMVMSTNSLPIVPSRSDDYALWKRLIVIRFPFSFVDHPQEEYERQKDKDLMDRLIAQPSGILAWLVRGCLAWQREGFEPVPDAIKMILDEYDSESDIIGDFIKERCYLEPLISTQSSDLYNTYCQWCKDTGRHEMNIMRFGTAISKRFAKTPKPYVYYKGIGINN